MSVDSLLQREKDGLQARNERSVGALHNSEESRHTRGVRLFFSVHREFFALCLQRFGIQSAQVSIPSSASAAEIPRAEALAALARAETDTRAVRDSVAVNSDGKQTRNASHLPPVGPNHARKRLLLHDLLGRRHSH